MKPRYLWAILAFLAAALAPGMDQREAARLLASSATLALKTTQAGPADRAPAFQAGVPTPGETAYFIVSPGHRITYATRRRFQVAGMEPLDYIPVNHLVVRATEEGLRGLLQRHEIQGYLPLQPVNKLSPTLFYRFLRTEDGETPVYLNVEIWPDEQMDGAVRAVADAGAAVIRIWHVAVRRLRVRAKLSDLPRLAATRQVKFIEPVGHVTLRSDATSWVLQSNQNGLRSLWNHGLHGEGQIIGHIDGNIDMNHCQFLDPTNNTPGPNHRKVVAYHSSSGLGSDAHGTHTAGTAAGDQSPITGNSTQNGHAFAARISHSNLNDITGWNNTTANLAAYLALQHADGARIHTNSWGEDYTTEYTSFCVDIDTFSHDYEESLVAFAETNVTGPVFTPENAKNCLGVGLTEPPPNQDRKPWGGSAPTADGRRKPEIFAPGSSTFSARSGSSCSFVSMGGTSMASPAITGEAALARQYFVDGFYPSGTKTSSDSLVPSGALLKAILMNATVDMTTIPGYPSNREGWGRLLLDDGLYFAGESRHLVAHDVRNASGLQAGGSATYTVSVTSQAEPLRVTLVFTDAEASLLASLAPVNDLNLEVIAPGGTSYLGNVFDTTAGESIPGGTADSVNNVEQVLLRNPPKGEFTIHILAPNVPTGPQGYALVVTGAVTEANYASQEIVTGPGPWPSSPPVAKTWDHTSPPASSVSFAAHGGAGYGLNVAGGDLMPGVPGEILTGPGPGVSYGPQVRAFDATGSPFARINFYAYGTLRYGVHAAPLSADGDPHGEIVTTPGPGGVFGPHVRGFNHDGGKVTAIPGISFYAYRTLRFGARVAPGLADSDPEDEVATGPGPGAVFGPHVRLFDLSPLTPLVSFFSFSSGFYGASIATGDLDGDGIDEIAAAHGPDPALTSAIRGFTTAAPVAAVFSVVPFAAALAGAEPALGDLDADGQAELVAAMGASPANGSEVRGFELSGGTGTQIPGLDFWAYSGATFGAEVSVADMGIP